MTKKGFSLIEMLVYIAILSIVLLMFTNILLSINRSYVALRVGAKIDLAAISGMEKITRELRSSTNIDLAQTIFGQHPGVLVLNQVDSSGLTSKVTFSLTNQVLHIWRDGIDQGMLLPSGVTVPRLVFYGLDSGKSKAVKIEMSLEDKEGGITRSNSYYSTVILRESYK